MINYKLLLLYMLESFLMVYVGMSIFRLKVETKRVVSIVLIYGITIYSVRAAYETLGIPLGTHTIIVLFIFTLCNIFITKISVIQAISITYIGSTLQAISEWLVTIPLVTKHGLTVDSKMFETWIGIGIGLTGYMLLIFLAIIFMIKRKIDVKARPAYKKIARESYEE